ncbi:MULTISPECIES: hypothetical protein [unclassified Exiguobacterium]|uniref:hypothetical protein n=1 Tax=unclassified Exiguobacterium TaxID=2644629 RepID=UPI001EEFD02B|nr:MULTISPECIES: hypothetical protein [unclassified Exiguobacterium]
MKKLMLTTFCTITLVSGVYHTATGESFVSMSQSISVDQNEIERYLTTEVMEPNFGGDVWTTYKILDTNTTKNEVYVWALIQEYIQEGDRFEQGTGMSVPLVLYLDDKDESFTIQGHRVPRDGSYYPTDLWTMFPVHVQVSISPHPDGTVTKLHAQMKEKLSQSQQAKHGKGD